jgi:hypothetical protein
MHRSITASVPATATAELVERLTPIDHVLSVAVSKGESVKPQGDVITIHLLNRGADDVLRTIADAHGEITVVTGLADSLSNPGKQHQIDNDVDEGIWEEMESGLVHHGRLTINYFILMMLGGVIAGAGLGGEPIHAAAAIIAASIIAPGYEPLAKIPLSLVLRRWPILRHALISVVVGYTALVMVAALTIFALTHIGEIAAGEIATLAGAIMITSFRETVLAGPLIALALISTSAVIGAGFATLNIELLIGGLKRLLLDSSFVILLGLIVFGLKRFTTHQRDPIV